jgi:hypothetical protein
MGIGLPVVNAGEFQPVEYECNVCTMNVKCSFSLPDVADAVVAAYKLELQAAALSSRHLLNVLAEHAST